MLNDAQVFGVFLVVMLLILPMMLSLADFKGVKKHAKSFVRRVLRSLYTVLFIKRKTFKRDSKKYRLQRYYDKYSLHDSSRDIYKI